MKANLQPVFGLMWDVILVETQDDGSLWPGEPTQVNNTNKHAQHLRKEQNPGGGCGDSSVPWFWRPMRKSTTQLVQPEIKEEDHGGVHVKSRNEGP